MTIEVSDRRANQTGLTTVKYWIENYIEASKDDEEMPIPDEQPISYIKTSFLWSLFYLKKIFKLEEAI